MARVVDSLAVDFATFSFRLHCRSDYRLPAAGGSLGRARLPIVSVCVAIIFFAGGLTLDAVDLTQIRRVLVNLIGVRPYS